MPRKYTSSACDNRKLHETQQLTKRLATANRPRVSSCVTKIVGQKACGVVELASNFLSSSLVTMQNVIVVCLVDVSYGPKIWRAGASLFPVMDRG